MILFTLTRTSHQSIFGPWTTMTFPLRAFQVLARISPRPTGMGSFESAANNMLVPARTIYSSRERILSGSRLTVRAGLKIWSRREFKFCG
jgi:hypothetical protein